MYRNPTLRIALCLAAILSCASPARADYEAGQTAWTAGRHAEALTQWQAAARTGDGKAMLALGQAFARGLGVPQDYILAHMWLNLAAGRGSAEAARERDGLAANMIPQHIASAQELARAWLSGRGANAPKAEVVQRAAAPTAPASPPPPRAIREAQALMTALGYEPGPADGRWGPRPGRAYATFLRDAGLPRTQMLTPDGLRAMRAAAKGRNVAVSAASPRQEPPTRRNPARSPVNLHRLVAAGDIDGLKTALATGGDANVRDGKGRTALMHAADKGHTLLVPPLLKAGADPNIRASDGATALFMAAVHGHSKIIEALTAAGADPSIEGPRGMTAERLIAARIVQEKYGGRPNALHEALQANESSAVIAALLNDGADISARTRVINEDHPQYPEFYTPLHTAAKHSTRPDVISLLLDRGARADAEVEAKYGDEPPKGNGTTAWALAASMNESVDVAMLLIDRAGGLNAQTKYGHAPIHWAAGNKSPELAKRLIERGANVNTRDKNLFTPLHSAAQNKNVDIAKLLIDHGAHIDGSSNGLTPLHSAVGRTGNIAVAKILLERGANLRASAQYFATPLHYAATEKNVAAAVLLSKFRKNHETCFKIKKSVHCGEPVCWATRKENNAQMIMRLLDLGAKKFPKFFLNSEAADSRCMFEVLTKHSPHSENRAAARRWMERNGVRLENLSRQSVESLEEPDYREGGD